VRRRGVWEGGSSYCFLDIPFFDLGRRAAAPRACRRGLFSFFFSPRDFFFFFWIIDRRSSPFFGRPPPGSPGRAWFAFAFSFFFRGTRSAILLPDRVVTSFYRLHALRFFFFFTPWVSFGRDRSLWRKFLVSRSPFSFFPFPFFFFLAGVPVARTCFSWSEGRPMAGLSPSFLFGLTSRRGVDFGLASIFLCFSSPIFFSSASLP